MSVQQIGKNSAEEFFETILYMTAYNEARQVISEYTKDIDNPVIKEALESSMNVLVFGAVMYAVKYQEKAIEKIFDIAESLIYALILKAKGSFNRFRGSKGSKLFRKLSFLQGRTSEDIAIAQIVATNQGFKSNAKTSDHRNQNSSTTGTLQAVNDTKQTLYQRENLHMQFGNAMASRYNETLLFKLFTKSFTSQDELLIKKILGRDTGAVLNVEDLNQVADFLFVKDTEGKIMGLSEAFYSLINGLGYMHNKA